RAPWFFSPVRFYRRPPPFLDAAPHGRRTRIRPPGLRAPTWAVARAPAWAGLRAPTWAGALVMSFAARLRYGSAAYERVTRAGAMVPACGVEAWSVPDEVATRPTVGKPAVGACTRATHSHSSTHASPRASFACSRQYFAPASSPSSWAVRRFRIASPKAS